MGPRPGFSPRYKDRYELRITGPRTRAPEYRVSAHPGDGLREADMATKPYCISGEYSLGRGLARIAPRITDFAINCERNLVERFFNKIKHYRGIATRLDKLASTFLAGVILVSMLIWLS